MKDCWYGIACFSLLFFSFCCLIRTAGLIRSVFTKPGDWQCSASCSTYTFSPLSFRRRSGLSGRTVVGLHHRRLSPSDTGIESYFRLYRQSQLQSGTPLQHSSGHAVFRRRSPVELRLLYGLGPHRLVGRASNPRSRANRPEISHPLNYFPRSLSSDMPICYIFYLGSKDKLPV